METMLISQGFLHFGLVVLTGDGYASLLMYKCL